MSWLEFHGYTYSFPILPYVILEVNQPLDHSLGPSFCVVPLNSQVFEDITFRPAHLLPCWLGTLY